MMPVNNATDVARLIKLSCPAKEGKCKTCGKMTCDMLVDTGSGVSILPEKLQHK